MLFHNAGCENHTFFVLINSLHLAKLFQLVPQLHHRLIPHNTIPEFQRPLINGAMYNTAVFD